MSKTCADCSLRNNDEPDEKIYSEFIPAKRKTDNQPKIYCHECSKAGDAHYPVYHAPPTCSCK